MDSTTPREVFDIVQALFKVLECPICLELMEDPFSTGCNHHFCRKCIQTVFKKKFKACCPLCNTSIKRRGLNENLLLVELVATTKDLHSSVKRDSGYDVTPPRSARTTMLSSPEGRSSLEIFNLLHPTPFKRPGLTLKACDSKTRGRKRKLDIYMDEGSSHEAVQTPCSSSNTNIRSGFPPARKSTLKSKTFESSFKDDKNVTNCETEKIRNEKLAECFQSSLLHKRKVGRPPKTMLPLDELLDDDTNVTNPCVNEQLAQRFQSSSFCKRKVGRPPKNSSIKTPKKLLGDELKVTSPCDEAVMENEEDSSTSHPLHLLGINNIKPILEESIFELPASWIPDSNKKTVSRNYSKVNFISAKKNSNIKKPTTTDDDLCTLKNESSFVCNETAQDCKERRTVDSFQDSFGSFGLKKKIFRSRNDDCNTKKLLRTEKAIAVDAYTFFPSQRTPKKGRGRKPKAKKVVATKNTLDKHLNTLSKKLQEKNGLYKRLTDISLSSSELCGVSLANKENLKKSGHEAYEADSDFAMPTKRSKSIIEDDIILFCTPACTEESGTPTKKCVVSLNRLDTELVSSVRKDVGGKRSVKNKSLSNGKGSFPSTQEKITTLTEEIASAECFELSINSNRNVQKTKPSTEVLMESGQGSIAKTTHIEKFPGPNCGKNKENVSESNEKGIVFTSKKDFEMQKNERKCPSTPNRRIFNSGELDNEENKDVNLLQNEELKYKKAATCMSKRFNATHSEKKEKMVRTGKSQLSKKQMQDTRKANTETLQDETSIVKQVDEKHDENASAKGSTIQGKSWAKRALDSRRCEVEISRKSEGVASCPIAAMSKSFDATRSERQEKMAQTGKNQLSKKRMQETKKANVQTLQDETSEPSIVEQVDEKHDENASAKESTIQGKSWAKEALDSSRCEVEISRKSEESRDNRTCDAESMKGGDSFILNCSFSERILSSDSDSDSEPIPYIYMGKSFNHSSPRSETNFESKMKVAEVSDADQHSDSDGESFIDDAYGSSTANESFDENKDIDIVPKAAGEKRYEPASPKDNNLNVVDPLRKVGHFNKNSPRTNKTVHNEKFLLKENIPEEVEKTDPHDKTLSDKKDLADDEDDFDIDNLEMYIQKSDRKTFALDVPTLELEELGQKASTLDIIYEACANSDVTMPDENILPKSNIDSHSEGCIFKTTEQLGKAEIELDDGSDKRQAGNSLEGSPRAHADDKVINSFDLISRTPKVLAGKQTFSSLNEYDGFQSKTGNTSNPNFPSKVSELACVQNFCTDESIRDRKRAICSGTCDLLTKMPRQDSQNLIAGSTPPCSSARVNVKKPEQDLITPSESKINSDANVEFSEGCLTKDASLIHYLSAVARQASCPSCKCNLDIRLPKVTILISQEGVKCTMTLGEVILLESKFNNKLLPGTVCYEAHDSKHLLQHEEEGTKTSQPSLVHRASTISSAFNSQINSSMLRDNTLSEISNPCSEDCNKTSQPSLVHKSSTISSAFKSQINSSVHVLKDNIVQQISNPCSDVEMFSTSKNQDDNHNVNDITDSDIQNMYQQSPIQSSNFADAECSPIKKANANIGEDAHLSDFEDDFEDTSEVDRLMVENAEGNNEIKQECEDINVDVNEDSRHISDEGQGLNANEDSAFSLDACTLEYKSTDDESDMKDVQTSKTKHVERYDIKGIFQNSQSNTVANAERSPIKNVDTNIIDEEACLSDFEDDFENTSKVDRLIAEKEVVRIDSKNIKEGKDINVDAVFDENSMDFSDTCTNDMLETRNNNVIQGNRFIIDEGENSLCSLDACTVEYKSTDEESDMEDVQIEKKEPVEISRCKKEQNVDEDDDSDVDVVGIEKIEKKESKMADFLKFNYVDTDDPDYKFADSLVAPLKNLAAQKKAAHSVRNATSNNLPFHAKQRGKSPISNPEESTVPKKFRRIKCLSNSSSNSTESQVLQDPCNLTLGKTEGAIETPIMVRTVIISDDDPNDHNENTSQNMAKVYANIEADLKCVPDRKETEKMEENKPTNNSQDEVSQFSQCDEIMSCCTVWPSQSIPRTTQDKVKIQMEIDELKKTIKKMESQLGKLSNYQSTEEQSSCKENMKPGAKTPKKLTYDSDEEMFSPPIPPTPPLRQAAGTVSSRSKFSIM